MAQIGRTGQLGWVLACRYGKWGCRGSFDALQRLEHSSQTQCAITSLNTGLIHPLVLVYFCLLFPVFYSVAASYMFFILPYRQLATTCKPSSIFATASQVNRRLRRVIPSGLAHVTASHSWKITYSTASTAISAADMETVDSSNRLAELRKLMRERDIDIYGWWSILHLTRV